MTYLEAVAKAKYLSIVHKCVQHVNETTPDDKGNDQYIISDWYDYEMTVISFERGKELQK